jgi:hypothetical protein
VRGGNALGRFDSEYEVNSAWDGISRELQRPVGQDVLWYRYESSLSTVDPVYDVGSPQGGRAYRDPVTVPVINAYVTQGQQFDNDRGLYMVDILRLFINFEDVMRIFPTLLEAPDVFIKDRVMFRGQLYVPNRVNPRGQVSYDYLTLTVDLTQLKPEETYNDVYLPPTSISYGGIIDGGHADTVYITSVSGGLSDGNFSTFVDGGISTSSYEG